MLEKLRERVKKGRETRSKKRAGRAARGERGEALENEGGVVELAAANCGEENGDAGEAGGNGFEAANGFEGPIENILRSGRPKAELTPDVPWLVIREARQNNLKGIDARIPLGRFTCVTGVSGSGKSSLVNDILYAGLARELNGAECTPGEFAGFAVEAAAKEGSRKGRETRAANGGGKPRKAKLTDYLDKIIAIDQTPIGRTPRSNPATYIKLFDLIRDLYTKLPDAKLRGYKPGRFSFNVASGSKGGGRCEACEGNGANKIEMDFLADVWVMCPVCEGRRFSRETLQIHYKGKSIADVLQMDVQQALEHFDSQPRIRAML